MQPHDTQRFPAYDQPGIQYAPTEQFAPAPTGRGSGTGGRAAAWIIGGIVAVVVLLVVGLVGLELGVRNSVKQQVSAEMSESVGAPVEVELGARPVLLSFLTGSLGSVHITTDGSTGSGGTEPAPALDIRADGVRTEGETTRVESLTGTAFVSDEMMTAAAVEDGAAGPLGGLIAVQDIVSDPAAGTLRVSIGGLAEATVTPRLVGGTLEMKPEGATILGFPLPTELLGGAVSMMDSTLAELPDGLQLTGVRVVPGGMIVDLAGEDVVLEPTR